MKKDVKYEKEYIQYLIENKKSIDTKLLDKYFSNEIEFESLIVNVDLNEIQSFQCFSKSKKIDILLGNI